MKKYTGALVLVVMLSAHCFPQAKPGGVARQVAMGGSNFGPTLVLNPFIMNDPAWILINPAYQHRHGDYGWANVSGGGLGGLTTSSNGYSSPLNVGGQNAGVGFVLGENWTAGAILAYDPSAINSLGSSLIIGFISQRSPQPIPPVRNVWEAVVSHRVASTDIGFGIMHGWSNYDSSNSAGPLQKVEAYARVWGFRGGLIHDLGDGAQIDATLVLRLDRTADKVTRSTGTGGEYSTSGTEFEVTSRALLPVSRKFSFVPYARLVSISAEPKENLAPQGDSSTRASLNLDAFAWMLGVGGEFQTEALFIAGGLSWHRARITLERTLQGLTKIETTYTAIPVLNLGAEWWFTRWLAGRAGYYRAVASLNVRQEVPGSNTTEVNLSAPNSGIRIGGLNEINADGLVTVGLGLRFGGWALDATVSEEALRRGLGLIGAQDNINTFGYITLSFNFAE